MNTLIILVGLPGTGKSSWIKKNIPEYIVVSSDEIRECLFGKSKSTDNIKTVEAFTKDAIVKSLEYGSNVVLDGYNLKSEDRKKILEVIPSNIIKKAIYFSPNMERLLHRFKKSHDFRPEVLNQMLTDIEIPSLEEGFNEVAIL